MTTPRIVVYKTAREVPRPIYKQLYSLNLREEGCLRYDLSYERNTRFPDAKVIVCLDEDRVLSWGLLVAKHYQDQKDFQLYTRRTERKKGYGKMVYQKARSLARGKANLTIHPHDQRSIAFFCKVHKYRPWEDEY